MQASLFRVSSTLPHRLRRLLIVSGLVIGTLNFASNVMTEIAWEHLFRRTSPHEILQATPMLLLWAAPALLLVGIAGFQQRKRWARPVLLTYAAAWMIETIVLNAMRYVSVINASYWSHGLTLFQKVTQSVNLFEPLIYEWVYPIILIVCLRMPELTDPFLDSPQGFAPVLASDQASTPPGR